MVRDTDPQWQEHPKPVLRLELTQKIPTIVSVIIREILHNLRSPLDQICFAVHTNWTSSLTSKPNDRGVQFPFGDDLDKFKTALKKQQKFLPSDALSLIESAKPYRGGNDLLWAIYELNRRDKHRLGLIPISAPDKELPQRFYYHWSGLYLFNGTGPGQGFRPTSPDGEFGPGTPSEEFDAQLHPSPHIAFSDAGLEGQPVVAVLNQMRELVERILLAFETRFFA